MPLLDAREGEGIGAVAVAGAGAGTNTVAKTVLHPIDDHSTTMYNRLQLPLQPLQ